jgi:ABC-type Mn2+/Zn2+ transport system permease subunit
MRSALGVAMAFGLASVFGGLTIASYADLPPGGTIVLLAGAAFLLTSGLHAVRLR